MKAYDEGLSYGTVKRIYANLRKLVCEKWNQVQEKMVLEGTIEIDESLFIHKSGSESQHVRQIWIVGMIEADTKRTVVQRVDNREAKTLIELI